MKTLLIIILFSLLMSCNNKNNKLSKAGKIDTLLYSNKSYHGFKKLSIYSNKRFKLITQHHYDLGYSKITGLYTKTNNRLILNPVLCLECKYVNLDNIVKSVCDTIKFSNLEFKVKTNYFSFNWKKIIICYLKSLTQY
jgi:predicted Zn-ribbon and HTH transcriptional regulator